LILKELPGERRDGGNSGEEGKKEDENKIEHIGLLLVCVSDDF
jgi:hypothetical protein